MQPKAFNEWVQPLSNKLYSSALRLVVNREDAKDIVQEVVLKLWEKRNELDTIEYPEAWAMKIVMNKSLDWLKKHKPIYMDLNDNVFQVNTSDDISKHLHHQEQLNTIHHLVQQMKPLQKAIFELREIQGRSYTEIAELLEIDINQVKVNLHRIRKKLKEHCEALEDYGIAKN
ncbi:MAG: sigma-70 family RNA polymerase sigma factor [Bacteroidetes bacterium]|nr:sigma-70 family RNA polymerase sigma factor [Bacteroidota bacterium]